MESDEAIRRKEARLEENVQKKTATECVLAFTLLQIRSLSSSGSVSLELLSFELKIAGVYSCWRRVSLSFSTWHMAAMGKEQLWRNMGIVTRVSIFCASAMSLNEAYIPLQTAVICSAGYADHDSCTAAASSENVFFATISPSVCRLARMPGRCSSYVATELGGLGDHSNVKSFLGPVSYPMLLVCLAGLRPYTIVLVEQGFVSFRSASATTEQPNLLPHSSAVTVTTAHP